MNKATIFALLFAGLVVGAIGVICASQASKEAASEEPLFVG
jgi:hypothetical protein